VPDEPVVPTGPVLATVLAQDASGVRTLTLNRPDAYNAFNVEIKEKLLSELRSAAGDDAVRAIVLTGAGRAFSAGQDLKEHIASLGTPDGPRMRTVEEHYAPLVRAVLTMPKPVIAAVNGTAAGAGASLAFACDLRIAAESAKFILAFAGVGLSADTAASWTLPRLVGYGRAMEMMLLGEPVTAPNALTIGMVNRVVPDGAALTEATALASRLAAGPTTAYAKIKEALLVGASGNVDDALATEARTQAELGATTDHLEAVQAFIAKRKPSFTGR
jgi:2-(1,2-epoxy-1,2-dihydrophenyl)acetyl-CoA isomerase